MKSKKNKFILRLLFFVISFNTINSNAQTPGLIVEGTDPNNVLDPNNDGYVSLPPGQTPSQFTNVGFPANILASDINDVLYSEISFSGIPQANPEPIGDLTSGPVCGFTDLVVDANDNSTYYYKDGTDNMIFRFRMGDAKTNSKGYSVLIDTDAKFGFTGPNADPNAVVGNPGFEVEIVLRTNFSVDAYNVDGANSPVSTIITRPYTSHAIKSLALTTNCNDPDYFYDFYLSFSDLTGFISATTNIRMVTTTSNSPGGVIGGKSSDISGVNDSAGTQDDLFIDIIDNQTPTDGPPIVRADCPLITGGSTNNPGSIINGDTQVFGTSTEEDGTEIEVFVNGGMSPAGTATVSGGTWSATLSALSTDDVITATATVPSSVASGVEKGTSEDNCDTTIVLLTDCTKLATPSFSSYTNGGRTLNLTYAAGTPSGSNFYFNFYDASTGTQITTINGTPVVDRQSNLATSVQLNNGKKFTNESLNFVVTVDTNPKTCESLPSEPISTCTSGPVSVTPFLDPIEVGDTTISGNFGGSPPTSATLRLIINGSSTTFTTSTTGSSNTFSFDISGTTLSTSDAIKVSNRDFGTACRSTESIVVNPTTVSLEPIVDTEGCFNGNATEISGTSSEIGGTITLYSKAGTGVTTSDINEGTTTVQPDGSWTVTGLNITAGNYVAATALGIGKTVSSISNEVLISSKTTFTTLTITSDPIIEGDTSISGTSSGLPTGSTIQLYLDGAIIDSKTTITDGSGNWTISGLDNGGAYDELYLDAAVTVTATSTVAGSCESDQSASKVVVCNPPATPTITAVSSSPICENSKFIISITSAQPGLGYQLLDQDGNTVGPTIVGPNPAADVNIESDPISSGVTGLKVRAFRILGTCTSVESNELAISVNPAPTITLGANPSAVFNVTAQTVDLTYSATTNSPSEYQIDFDDVAFTDVIYTALPASPIQINVPAGLAVGVYTATLTIRETTNGCEKSYPITITITDASTPTITLTNTSVDVCSGTTTANFAYSATTNTPNQYSINFTDAANLQGFIDISNASLPATPIVVTVPTVANGGSYTGILTVRNSSTGSVSAEYQITVNIEKTTPGTIGVDQTILSGNDVVAFTSIEDASGIGGVTYQWQKSTTSATAGFADIGGATSATFDEGTIAQTTYYKRIATSITNGCLAESNVITVTVLSLSGIPMITQVYQVGNERWIEITNISGSTINANEINVQLYKDKNIVFSGQTPDANFTITSALNPGESVLIKNSLSTTVTNISGVPLIDNSLTEIEGGNDFITLSVTTDGTSWDNRYDIVSNIPSNSSLVRIDEVSETNSSYTESEWVVFIDDALNPYRLLGAGGAERHPHDPLISEITGSNTEANTLLGLHRVGSTTRTSSAWNNGFPDRSRFVIIDEDYDHSGSILSARKLTVNASNKLGITDNLLVVTNDIVLDGDIRLISSSGATTNGESQLIQTHTSASLVTGSGRLLVDQNSTIASIYRYNYMSSPVQSSSGSSNYTIASVFKDGTTATNFAGIINTDIARDITFLGGADYDGDDSTSPITLADYWMYTFAPSTGARASWIQTRSAGTISNTDGFIFKGPGIAQNYTFLGFPNDGRFTTTIGANESYLVGNPYSSAISVKEFIEDNIGSITGTLYFWEHVGEQNDTDINGHFFNGYIGGYATRTISMGVSAVNVAGSGAVDIKLEAENATTNGVIEGTLDNDGTTSIDVVSLDTASENIQFNTINRSVDSLKIRYKSANTKSIEILVNGVSYLNTELSANTQFEVIGFGICVVSGDKVTIQSKDSNTIQIDYLNISDPDGSAACSPSIAGNTVPADYIPIGQGFFVSGDSDGGTITFNNSQREYKLEGTDAVFFKSSSKSKQNSSSKLSIIKLGMDFSNNSEDLIYHRQIGISFSPYQSFAYDKGYEAEAFDVEATDFYWKFPIDDRKFVIAGVQSISNDLEVPLEITMAASGDVNIKVDERKNYNQAVYILDKVTGTSYNIVNGVAALTLDVGKYTDRFFLAFKPSGTLAINDEITNSYITIFVDNANDFINIKKKEQIDIKEVQLFSILGKQLDSWNISEEQESYQLKIARKLPTGVYVVKFNSDKGKINKKVVIE